MVSINRLAEMIMQISGKNLKINHIPGPLGVRGRNSDNRLIQEKLGWRPSAALEDGLRKTYSWIADQVAARRGSDEEVRGEHSGPALEPVKSA
jgi:nucleoside-diphosphate-sugar epimerase